jgi:ferrous iron transport protein A
MDDLIPLNLLIAGQSGVVSHLAGCRDTAHRLHELGLREGAEVEMVQPGSPCIVRLAGNKLCFRADDLLSVLVRQVPAAGASA